MKVTADRRTVHRFVTVEFDDEEPTPGNDAPFAPTLLHLRMWYGQDGTLDVAAAVYGMNVQRKAYVWDVRRYGQPGAPFPEYVQKIIEEVK